MPGAQSKHTYGTSHKRLHDAENGIALYASCLLSEIGVVLSGKIAIRASLCPYSLPCQCKGHSLILEGTEVVYERYAQAFVGAGDP